MNNIIVSKDGKIYDDNGIVKTSFKKYGLRGKYYEICKYGSVHRLVAESHVINTDPKTKIHVHHIDENTKNNHYTNLMWVSPPENNRFSKCCNEYVVLYDDVLYTTHNLALFCVEFILDIGALRKTSNETNAKDKRKHHKGYRIYSKKHLELSNRDLNNISKPYIKIESLNHD